MLAVAVVPAGPSLELIAPVVFTCVPAAVPVTFTENVHDPLAARLPPARAMLLPPAAAVMVPVPQEPVMPFGVDTINPAGSVSLKAMPSTAMAVFGFVTVKVMVAEVFNGMLGSENDSENVGEATTMMEPGTLVPAPPSVELTDTLLFFVPAVVPVTFTETVQEALTASAPPDKTIDPEPATAVTVPPQVSLNPLGVASTRPAGKVSESARPLNATLVLGLVMV